MLGTILIAAAAMLALALAFCAMLVAANVRLHVEVDPAVEQVEAMLPGANCGGCGLAGCSPFARAVVGQAAPVDGCTVGGPDLARRIADALGVEVTASYPYRPVIHCGASADQRLGRGRYIGEPTCAAADVVGGVQGCTWGCLGFGDCVLACEYGAMALTDGLPRILYEHCVGCGACVRSCPRGLIEQIPFKVERMMVVACSNHDPTRSVREVCRTGCIGCSSCARILPGLFSVAGHLASIDYERYSGEEDFEKALDKCPMKSMVYLGKPPQRYARELAGVGAVTESPAPPQPPRPTAEDMNWRG